jgi:hypothetical protein
MTPISGKTLPVDEKSSQHQVLVQIELEKCLGSFQIFRFGEDKKPFTGTCCSGQFGLFYYRDPGLAAEIGNESTTILGGQ